MLSRPRSAAIRALSCAACALAFVGGSFAQTFVNTPTRVNAYTYSWMPLTIKDSGGSFLTDGTLDQQTGQASADFVGSTSNPGFFIRTGTIGGADAVGFRFMMNKVDTGGTFAGQVSVGLDTTGDGALDVVFTAAGKPKFNGISYQVPGMGENVSPSTTSLGNPVLVSSFTSSNFSYTPVNSAIYPNYAQFGPEPDVVLTFALTFTQVNDALDALGLPAIDVTSLVRFVAFTSNQPNSINQDVYGTTGLSSATRFDAGGGMSEYTDFDGKPVPEPSTMAAVAAALGVGVLLRKRRQRRERPVPAVSRRTLPAA